MKKLMTLAIAIVTAFILFAFTLNSQINAIQYGSIGGRPVEADWREDSGWFIYNLDLGEQVEDAVLVINSAKEPNNVLVYAADSVKSSSGGFALRQLVEEKKSVGAWIKFYPEPVPEEFKTSFSEQGNSIIAFCELGLVGSEEWCGGVESMILEMDPQERREVPFVFSMPDNADAGEHTGGILIQESKEKADDEEVTPGISLSTRVGVRVYQTVPGEMIKELYLDEFSVTKKFDEFDYSRLFGTEVKKPESFLVTAKIGNSGNVSTYFEQSIKVTDDLFGTRNTEIDGRRFQILRDDVFHSNYSWENPRFGKFTFETTISYVDANEQTQSLEIDSITMWIIPWREIALSAAIIAFILLLNKVRVMIYNRRYGGKGWEGYTVRAGDTLDQLADRYNVSWKKLMKTNELKAPYILKQGQRILVPAQKEDK